MPADKNHLPGANRPPTADPRPTRGSGRRHGMPQAGEKPQHFSTAVARLANYCRRSLPVILIALGLAAAASILNVIGPHYLAVIADLIIAGMAAGIDIDAVASLAGLLAAFYGLSFLFNVVQSFIMSDMAQRTVKRLRGDMAAKINRLPLKYFDRSSVGDVLSRVTNDADTVGQSLTQSLSAFINSITMVLGSLIMMFWTNWLMALSGVLATLLGLALMMLIISRSQQYFRRQQNELGRINGHIEEHYTGHHIVRVYNGVREAKATFDAMNARWYRSAWKSQFMSGLMTPLMAFVGNLGYVVVCIVGAVLAVNGYVTFGVIVAFMLYIRLFTQPLSQLAQIAANLQSAAAASERIFSFLGEEEVASETGKTQTIATVRGEVEFKNVSFGYEAGKPVIRNFSAQVKPGQKVALVGPTGAGKTTMVNLLMRFYELGGGSILIDGIPLDSLKRDNVRRLFGMVLQDTWLFEGTIRENIVYNQKEVSEQQLVAVCQSAGLYHFIRTLPRGWDTVLDDNANLSAGQKQLVTIARAMLENAPLLILDEATSSVDTRTEALIQKAMDELTRGRTSFVIAHRLSTIRNADLILVLQHGDIIESGTHDQLMAQDGFYAKLYHSQFEAV